MANGEFYQAWATNRLPSEIWLLKRDNVQDHRAGTSDLPFLKHAQARLRVHRFVIQLFDILATLSIQVEHCRFISYVEYGVD